MPFRIKKILFITALVLIVLPLSKAFAMYPFEAVAGPTSITATMTIPGGSNDTDEYQLYNGASPLIQVSPSGIDTGIKKAVNGIVTWTISGSSFANGTYTLHVKKLPPTGGINPNALPTVVTDTKIVTVGATTVDFFTWPLAFVQATGQSIVVSGTIDTTKYPNISTLEVQFQYSKSPFTTTDGPSDKAILKARSALGATGVEGVAGNGSYYFEVPSLIPKTTYFFRHVILTKGTTTVLSSKTGKFDSSDGYIPEGSVKEQSAFDAKSYHLLAPWPGLAVLMDPDLCAQQKALGKVGQNAICDINGFLNFVFKTLIGLTAVVLVLRLMYEGYQYLVTDVPFLKASAKSGFFTALMGLLLALSAYIILNTINPKLVTNSFSVDGVAVGIEEFIISGALSPSFSGTPTKVKFSTEAYPAAKIASEKTGVNISVILAEFQQETGNGSNVGKCHWTDPHTMKEDDKVPFQTITSELNRNPNTTVVSCASGGGWGGAIGFMQFRPATWLENRAVAASFLGHTPDPWKTGDALMVAAVYLKKLGAVTDPRNAACKYYSGSVCTPGRQPPNEFYGNDIMKKKAGFDIEIQKKKAAGEIQ